MKINLILLAAGSSSRFGENKLLHKIDGKPMYQRVTEVLNALPEGMFSKKIMVAQHEPILMDSTLYDHYTVVKNSDSSRGISSSIHVGMAYSEEDVDAWCFMVCDQPYLTKETILELVRNWIKSGQPLACVSNQNVLGNPTIFSNIFLDELLELHGDKGGKAILEKHRQEVYCYHVENKKELADVDHPFDLTENNG